MKCRKKPVGRDFYAILFCTMILGPMKSETQNFVNGPFAISYSPKLSYGILRFSKVFPKETSFGGACNVRQGPEVG